jgi:hypothetical protein
MLQEVLRSVEYVAQQLASSFHCVRVVSVDCRWLQVGVECFLPHPPFAAIWEETESPISHAKPACVVSDEFVSGITKFSQVSHGHQSRS